MIDLTPELRSGLCKRGRRYSQPHSTKHYDFPRTSCHHSSPRLPQLALCAFRIKSKAPEYRRMTTNQAKAKGWREDRYRLLIEALVAERKRRNLSQEELAARLGRKQHFISRYETGERRLDAIEFADIAASLGLDPGKLLMAHWAQTERLDPS